MNLQKQIKTDTATIVLFDVSRLPARLSDDADWWTGEGDLEREEVSGNVVFCDTGTDGLYQVVVTDEPINTHDPVKAAQISVPSGVLYFGAAEDLPAEDVFQERDLGRIELQPGSHTVQVYFRSNEVSFVIGGPLLNQSEIDSIAQEGSSAFSLVDCLGTPLREASQITAKFCSNPEIGVDGEKVWYSSPKDGIAFLFERKLLSCIHLYADGVTSARQVFSGFKGTLPHDLRFGQDQDEVLRAFGTPFKGSGKHWAIFLCDNHGIRVGFERSRLVTVNLIARDSTLLSR